MIDLDRLILEATKSGDSVRLTVLRNVKASKLNMLTAANAAQYTDVVELGMINKMVKELKGDVETFSGCGRQDLVDSALKEIEVLESFLPKSATIDDINKALADLTNGSMVADKKDMSKLIGSLKGLFPSTDGRMLADAVKAIIK